MLPCIVRCFFKSSNENCGILHNFLSVNFMQSTDNKHSVSHCEKRVHTSLFCSQRKSKDATLVAGENWGHNMSAAQVFNISPTSPVLSSHSCFVPVSFFDWTWSALFISEPKHTPELWLNLAAGSADRELAVSFSEVHGWKHKENTWRYNQTANSNNGARSSHHSCFSDYKPALHSKWTRSKQPYNTA